MSPIAYGIPEALSQWLIAIGAAVVALLLTEAVFRIGERIVRRAQAHGLIVRALGGDIIAFSPPLVITEAEIDEMFDIALAFESRAMPRSARTAVLTNEAFTAARAAG